MQKGKTHRTQFGRLTALCLSLLLAFAVGMPAARAGSGDRTLYLYYTHTKETGKFTFRKNGVYDQKVLSQLNWFLRDWRRNEERKMDPALFDLVWEVYQKVGATAPIYIVSAYRAPETNAMLRSRSSAVAKNSRHIQGMAMDFYIPGIPLKTLREAAMKLQVGGVGYYPTSGSPFVHLDVGNVRAWPRMTKAQLERLFPNGETLHLPSGSNTPLSAKGYQLAKAEWTQCHTIPCSNDVIPTTFAVAQSDSGSAPGGPKAGSGKTLMGWLFGNEPDDVDPVDESAPAGPVAVASAPVAPPAPAVRPAGLYGDGTGQPVDAGSAPQVATADVAAPTPEARPAWPTTPQSFAVASINPAAPVAPSTGQQPLPPTPAPLLAAYAPASAPAPEAQRAINLILQRQAKKAAANLNTAGLAKGTPDGGALSALLNGTMQSVEPSASRSGTVPAFEMRKPDFIAPDLAHVTALLVDPAFMSSDHYALISEHNAADFNPAAELGNLAPKLTIHSDPAFGLGRTNFSRSAYLLVATR